MFSYADQLVAVLRVRALVRPPSIPVRLSHGAELPQQSPLRVLCGLHVTASGPVANAERVVGFDL